MTRESVQPKRIAPFAWNKRYEFEKRTLTFEGKSTSISLERIYWDHITKLGSTYRKSWRYATRAILQTRPHQYESRAGWLRIWVLSDLLRAKKKIAIG